MSNVHAAELLMSTPLVAATNATTSVALVKTKWAILAGYRKESTDETPEVKNRMATRLA